MTNRALAFEGEVEILCHIDHCCQQTMTIEGWIASSEEISSLEFVTGAGTYEGAYGLPRPDVFEALNGAYPNAENSGFTIKVDEAALDGTLKVRFNSGRSALSNRLLVVTELNSEADDSKYLNADVPFTKTMGHSQWRKQLSETFNTKGTRILEVGSRVVTRAKPFRDLVPKAEYTGFDIYEGPNVDVVGDAHKLSSYFDGQFDLVFSSAVFEHLAMPWLAAEEIAKSLKVGGHVFVETHYCYGSHERPWHFFQFSEKALEVLFSPALGFECLDSGVSNPMVGRFSSYADEYLQNKPVPGLYCHSEFFGRKVREVADFRWHADILTDVAGETEYPKRIVE